MSLLASTPMVSRTLRASSVGRVSMRNRHAGARSLRVHWAGRKPGSLAILTILFLPGGPGSHAAWGQVPAGGPPGRSPSPDTVELQLASGDCSRCRLVLDTIAPPIGGPEDPVGLTAIDAVRYAVDPLDDVWLAPATADGELYVYRQPLTPVRVAGRGDGPREFRSVTGVRPTPGGEAWVYSNAEIRAITVQSNTIVGETRSVVPINVYRLLPMASSHLLVNGWGTYDDAVHALWRLQVDEERRIVSREPVAGFRVRSPTSRWAGRLSGAPIAPASDGFWVAAPERIALTHLDEQLRPTRVYDWDAPWFSEWDLTAPSPPLNTVWWVSSVRDGLIWLAVGAPASWWGQGILPEETLELPLPDGSGQVGVVVAIDVTEAVVTGEWLVPQRFLGVNHESVGLVREHADGHVSLTPVRFELVREGR